MTESDKVFEGSVPQIYDDYLVPLIFKGFAEDLAGRVASLSPTNVLETAAGSGVVTRALAGKLSDSCGYLVTDLNQAMLDQAAKKQGLDDRIKWQQADALHLPFEDDKFDAVCCQFGVMFFPDRVAGFAEARRVLRPGAKFVFNVWDKIEENEFARIITDSVGREFPTDPPQFLARTPHGYHDVDLVREELGQAGFSKISVETRAEVSRAPSPRHPAVAYCQGTPLRNEIESRNAGSLEGVTERAAQAISAIHGPEEVSGKIQGHVIVSEA